MKNKTKNNIATIAILDNAKKNIIEIIRHLGEATEKQIYDLAAKKYRHPFIVQPLYSVTNIKSIIKSLLELHVIQVRQEHTVLFKQKFTSNIYSMVA